MKLLKYILIVFILLLCPKVFAAEMDVTSKIKATVNYTSGSYYGGSPAGIGGVVPGFYNVNTRYNGTLSYIEFFLDSDDWDWNYNRTYTVTMNMATQDWRNHFMGPNVFRTNSDGSIPSTASNFYVSNSFRFVSYKTIKFNIKIGTTMGTYTKFTLYSGDNSNTAFTGVSNWNLSSIKISDVASSPTPTPVGPTPTPSINNQDIIDNNTQNTQDIIDNNTQNTSDIIENNNQNTQNIIDNQNSIFKDCSQDDMIKVRSFVKYNNSVNLTVADEHGINWTGQGATGLLFYQVIPVAPYTRYNLNYTRTNVMSDFRVYVYKGQADFSGSNIIGYDTTGTFSFDTGLTNYITVGFYTPTALSSVTYRLRNITLIPAEPICGNKLDALNDAINDTNAYLKDDSNPSMSDNEFTSLFDSVAINNPLSSLLQLPVQFINAIVNQSNSCQVVNLGTLLGVPITLPCIDIGSILGNSVWTTIDILSSIGLIVLILKQVYESITNALTLGGYMDAKKGGLGYMPPLEFLCSILTGFGGDI